MPNGPWCVETPAGLEKALAGLGSRSAGSRPPIVEARIDPSEYQAWFEPARAAPQGH